MEYGLTDKGLVIKPLQQILKEEREAFITVFGSDIDTSDESVAGAYIGNQAVKQSQLWEIIEGLWWAGDAESAKGIYLDRLVGLVNVTREPAASTQVHAALWGDEGTAIVAGQLSQMPSGENFALAKDVVIARDKLLGILLKIAEVETGHQYSFRIDTEVISYTAAQGDEEEEIQAGLIADLQQEYTQGTYIAVNNGKDGLEIHRADGIVPFYLFCDDQDIEVASLGTLGIYRAVVPGATFVPIGALNKIVTNVNGLTSIINYASGITGRPAESDAELRIAKNNRQKQASGNEVAIENEVKKIVGVQYARVYSNRSMNTHNGRPPKCFEVILVGGLDQEIAETIFRKGPAGIQAFGNTQMIVLDDEGFEQEIGFSRPENRYIWIKIAYSKNPEEPFPVNGIEVIKDNIDDWGAKNQGVGIDFVFQKLNRPIYDVSGIGLAEIKVAVTDDLTPPDEGSYVAANIEINERQIAIIDKSRIQVQEIVE